MNRIFIKAVIAAALLTLTPGSLSSADKTGMSLYSEIYSAGGDTEPVRQGLVEGRIYHDCDFFMTAASASAFLNGLFSDGNGNFRTGTYGTAGFEASVFPYPWFELNGLCSISRGELSLRSVKDRGIIALEAGIFFVKGAVSRQDEDYEIDSEAVNRIKTLMRLNTFAYFSKSAGIEFFISRSIEELDTGVEDYKKILGGAGLRIGVSKPRVKIRLLYGRDNADYSITGANADISFKTTERFRIKASGEILYYSYIGSDSALAGGNPGRAGNPMISGTSPGDSYITHSFSLAGEYRM